MNDAERKRPGAGVALERNLAHQCALYEEVLAQLVRQREALIHGKLEENLAVNHELDRLQGRLRAAEGVRAEAMQGVVTELAARGAWPAGTGAENIRCADLCARLAPEAAARLGELRQALADRVARAREENRKNGILLENARGILRSTVAIIAGAAGRWEREKAATYGASGRIMAEPKPAVSLFCRRA